MKQETKTKIVAANQILTLEIAKTLVGKCISVCCKDAAGNFSELVDTITIMNVSKVKGKKQYILLDQYGGFSYYCNGANFEGAAGIVYYISY
jgi:hypothetical protein